MLARLDLGARTFVFSFVGKHRPINNVSNRKESGNIRSVLFVDLDAASVS